MVREHVFLFSSNEEHHVWFFTTISPSPQNGVSIMVQVALGPDAQGEKVGETHPPNYIQSGGAEKDNS